MATNPSVPHEHEACAHRESIDPDMATIIIPAHNESAVISRCLDSIVNQAGVDHVIVACNGCSDDTAEIVRSSYPQVHCLDIETPSKVNAINEAEQLARELGVAFPIFYIDADTTLGEHAVQTISESLDSSDILLAAPTPRIDTSQSSWIVKQFYKVWTNLPYVKEGVIATCSYVITEQGRKRFSQFEDVIADDGFVRHHFRSSEIANIPGAEIHISAPKDTFSLIKIKTRSRLGFMELAAKNLLKVVEKKNYREAISNRLFSHEFPSVSVYLFMVLIIRIRAALQFRQLKTYTWETDLSSRVEHG